MIAAALAIWRGVPRWVWILLAAAILYRGALSWHAHKVKATVDAAYASGAADRDAHWIAKAREWEARINGINAAIRSENNETNRRIAGDADALRVRGPGKAACVDPNRAAVPAGGHVAPGGTGDDAVGQVPDDAGLDLIGLPFADTVDFAEQCDLNRAEVLSWRTAYERQMDAWRASQEKK